MPHGLCLIADQVLSGCPCHYDMHIGYYGDSVAIQVSVISGHLLQAIPCFQLGKSAVHLGSPFALSRRSFAVGWGG